MLAENLENLLRKARLEGFREGRLEGRQEVNCETDSKLVKLVVLSDLQIAGATCLTVADVYMLREEGTHCSL